MINVYMIDPKNKEQNRGDMSKIKNTYSQMATVEQVGDMKLSLYRPYKTEDQVVSALRRDPTDHRNALSKMHSCVRKDPNAMINLIKINADAYLYVSPQINDLEFKKKALVANPVVYNGLSEKDRKMQGIAEAYLEGMLNNMRRFPIDNMTMSLQFKNKFDQTMNARQVLSATVYEKAYENMVINGPYSADGYTLNKDFAIVAACRMLNKEDGNVFDEIDRNIWDRHPEKVLELANNDRRKLQINYALTAIETLAPQYAPLIEEIQRDYWRDRSHELMLIQNKKDAGLRLSGDETRMLEEAEKHISLDFQNEQEPKPMPKIDHLKDKELTNNILKIEDMKCEMMKQQEQKEAKIVKEREENLAYLINDSKTRILSAAASGDIEPEMASVILGYLGSMPTTTSSSRSYSVLENTEAHENDIDNIDKNLSYSDPELSEDPTIDQELEMRELKEEFEEERSRV
jgi:hypothetical protein